MSIGAISSNPLLLLNPQLRGRETAQNVWTQAPTNGASSAGPTTILPGTSATQISFENLLALQSLDELEPVLAPQSATQRFLEEAQKSPMERMREQMLAELGLSEEALAQLPAEERRIAEDKIRQMIEEKLRQAMGAEGGTPDSNAAMIEAVA